MVWKGGRCEAQEAGEAIGDLILGQGCKHTWFVGLGFKINKKVGLGCLGLKTNTGMMVAALPSQ